MGSPLAHAKLSPSAAARWMSCPASIRMEAALPPGRNDESAYALEGTIAHALGELEASLAFKLITPEEYLKGKREWMKWFTAQKYPAGTLEEMQGHVKDYVALIAERLKRYPNSQLLLEKRMDTGVPGSWGTSDTVIVSPQHIEIIDLKYGAGMFVSAFGNPQLRLYACGALDTFGDVLGETERVFMTVFQPRVEGYSTEPEELTAEELRAWRRDEVIPAAELALSEDAPFGPSEKACKWCPVAGICQARVEVAVREDFGLPYQEEPLTPTQPEVMTPEQLSVVLARLPEIRAWCTAVEDYALDAAYSQGQTIPGWKVVLSGGRRGITDHAAAIQTLIDAGFKAEQVAQPFKAKGIGDLEKLVGKKELPVLLGPLLAKSKGKESLVPEDDKRPAISPTSEAVSDFAAIEGEIV